MTDTTLARRLTLGCLETLRLGYTPTWERYRSRPTDPTPTYDETTAALGYAHDAIPRVLPGLSRAATLARPIPFRPLSYAVSRRTDPATSREAAASVIDPSKGTYAKILAAFKTLDRYGVGFTDEQLFDVWQNQHRRLGRDWPPISPSGLRSRRNELTRRGLIVDSGERAKTRAGRSSIVWRLA